MNVSVKNNNFGSCVTEANNEWMRVDLERFDTQRRLAVAATFLVQATDEASAIRDIDTYLETPAYNIQADAEHTPRTYGEILNITPIGSTNVAPVNSEERLRLNTVPGDHIRLIGHRALKGAD